MEILDNEKIETVEEESMAKSKKPSKTLKCFKTELVSVDEMTVDELFDGFDAIKAITFSYEIGFIEKVLSKFKFGEVVLGADFIVEE